MQNEHRNAELSADPAAAGAEVVECPSCHAALTRGLRFCRMCGYRLGEGVEEYAATRRFEGPLPHAAPPHAGPASAASGPAFQTPHAWGAMSATPAYGAPEASDSTFKKLMRACHPARFGWVFWTVVIIIAMTIGGAIIKVANDRGDGRQAAARMPRADLGVDGYQTAPTGGAFIEGIRAPGTPVEAAGLIGGDIIVNFDGQAIADEEEMIRVLRATPVGKVVAVVFLRDGLTQKTTMTVGSNREVERGWAAVDARPGGRGQFGISDLDRVRVPGREIYGVRIGDIDRNEPADLAGLKEGDIVIQFDGRPVRTEGDLRYHIYKALPGSIVKLIVVRGGVDTPIDVKVGRTR